MAQPSPLPDGAPRSLRPAPRSWALGLAGAGLFLAGGILGAILVLSIYLYRLPAGPSISPAGQGGTATAAPTELSSPQPTLSATVAPTYPPIGPAVGQQAPDFVLLSLDGSEHSLAEYRGRTVLVHFWAAWCLPCRQEWPEWCVFGQEVLSQSVVILAVNVEEPPEVVRDFVGDKAPSFPVLLDRDGSVNKAYRVTSLPVTFLVDAGGVVRQVVPGNMDLAALKRLIHR